MSILVIPKEAGMTKDRNLNKEQLATRKLMTLIQTADYPVGARLPSERQLSEIVDASRNTLRSALRQLQALGVVDIRSGSGSYILRKVIPPAFPFDKATAPSRQTIADVMEARYVIEPVIGAQAAAQASEAELDKLETCLTAMGRACINNLHDRFIEEERHFREVLASSTGNPLFIAIQNHFTVESPEWTLMLSGVNENDKAILFADYVDIFNAVKNKQPGQVYQVIQCHVLRLCRFLSDRQHIAMPATIMNALHSSSTECHDEEARIRRKT
jgi:GntR family transcriptional repressor for pyruvate dehydrogenase complex